MLHAVIVAHPRPNSLNHAIAETYRENAEKLGHTTLVRDLYGLKFDPCLKAHEIPDLSGVSFAPDVLAEREVLRDVDVFCLVYPFWFNAPPAILKGYVDRVFSMHFGYAPAPDGTTPLLDGRKLISFTTSGAPEAWVRDTGAMTALMALFDAHLAAMTGLTLLDHVHAGGIVPGITSEAVADVLDKVRDAVTTAFVPQGAPGFGSDMQMTQPGKRAG